MALLEVYAATATIGAGVLAWRVVALKRSLKQAVEFFVDAEIKLNNEKAAHKIARERGEKNRALFQQAESDLTAEIARRQEVEKHLAVFTAPRKRDAKGHFMKVAK